MSTLDDYQWPTCIICTRDLWENELERQACRPCQHRADTNLTALAGQPTYDDNGQIISGLYAALGRVLAPSGSHDSARTSGAPGARLPVRLEPLNLSAPGSTVTILQTWAEDWDQRMHRDPPRWHGTLQQQVDQAAAKLRTDLEWAASRHPVFDEFAREIRQLVNACRRQISGEPPERRVTVACPCGGTLSVAISTEGARCRDCGTQYDRADVLSLPLAERTIAA